MSSAPLLGDHGKGDGMGAGGKGGGQEQLPWWSRWLGRVVDTEEAAAQLRFAVPMVLTSMAYYGIPLVSVMFSGHLGDVHLAGATLGNSWATVTGYAFVVRAHRVPHPTSMHVSPIRFHLSPPPLDAQIRSSPASARAHTDTAQPPRADLLVLPPLRAPPRAYTVTRTTRHDAGLGPRRKRSIDVRPRQRCHDRRTGSSIPTGAANLSSRTATGFNARARCLVDIYGVRCGHHFVFLDRKNGGPITAGTFRW